MKILTIIGSRPQYIKHSILSEVLLKNHDETIIDTGQHYDYNMSEIFLKDLHVPKPQYNLGIHENSHAKQTGKMMCEIEKILLLEIPDLVVVYGDTNSTLSGAIAAKKLGFTVAHVESGARSYDMAMPEEINRRISDNICDILFSPTEETFNNLTKENVYGNQFLTGDIVIESVLKYSTRSDIYSNFLKTHSLDVEDYVLATIHRNGNTDIKENIYKIFKLFELSKEKIIFPMHPRTKKRMLEFSINPPKNVTIIDPIGYIDMISAMKSSKYIVTDSGGIQRESYALNKKCITMRRNTEWNHTRKGNWNILVGVSEKDFLKSINIKPDETQKYNSIKRDINASSNIANVIDKISEI